MHAVGPVVSSVWPLFGPQAGGTLVTVNGTELYDSQQPDIILISSDSDNIITLQSTYAAIQSTASNRYVHIHLCVFICQCNIIAF